MIKFFRKIRFDLMKHNKMGKYFKYAIGEILLVVIGILIALQINNWNEQRALYKKEKQYLTEIRSNLIQDTVRINEVIEANKTKMTYIQNTFEKFDAKYSKEERRAAFDFPVLGEFELFRQNNTAYSNLLSSSSIDLIRDARLKEMLSNYYNMDWEYKGNANITARTRGLVRYLGERFVTKEAIKSAFDVETNLPSINDYSLNEDAYFVAEFLSLVAMMGSANQSLIDFKSQNDSLRGKIDSYLKNQKF